VGLCPGCAESIQLATTLSFHKVGNHGKLVMAGLE
jgi:hypothetical protein